MTAELIDDDEVADTVTFTDTAPAQRRTRAATGLCKVCGITLPDARRSYCDDHRPDSSVAVKYTSNTTGKTKRVSGGTRLENGLTEFSAKAFFALTLIFAWYQLRRANVPDRDSDIAEEMAMTDEEAIAISRPICRIFAATEVGKRIGPKLIGAEDLIDAGFATWNYLKRNAEIWERLGRTPVTEVQTPPPSTNAERILHGNNGSNGTNQRESERSEPGPVYVPPAPQDIVADILG